MDMADGWVVRVIRLLYRALLCCDATSMQFQFRFIWFGFIGFVIMMAVLLSFIWFARLFLWFF